MWPTESLWIKLLITLPKWLILFLNKRGKIELVQIGYKYEIHSEVFQYLGIRLKDKKINSGGIQINRGFYVQTLIQNRVIKCLPSGRGQDEADFDMGYPGVYIWKLLTK